jgi:hypothetical protein
MPGRLIGCVAAAGTIAGLMAAQIPALAAQASTLKEQYPYVRFSVLAGFAVPEAEATGFARSPHATARRPAQALHIPPEVQALHGRPVSVRGYVLPLDVAGDSIRTFLLMASVDSCHYGAVGAVNEWILVTMAGKQPARVRFAQPVVVFGTLSIAPDWQGPSLVGLYRLTADQVVGY